MPKNLFVTGLPGSGKTTLIRGMAEELKDLLPRPAGFYTQEIRERGIRQGFELVALDGGRHRVLSCVSFKAGPFVGKYGVDVAGFESFLDGIFDPGAGASLVVVDEIGKMECLSAKFRTWVTALLDSGVPVLATVALRGTPFTEALKRRQDVRVYELAPANRDALRARIVADNPFLRRS